MSERSPRMGIGGLLCRLGFHAWRMFGPSRRDDGSWAAMWARCDCGASRYLVPNDGKYPRMIFGRGLRRTRTGDGGTRP